MQKEVPGDNSREMHPETRNRQLEIKRMEKSVVLEVSDSDYRTLCTPCLPLGVSIDHWR